MSNNRRDYERQRPDQRLGDEPVDAKYHQKMTAIAQAIDEFFNPGEESKVGFVLLVFPFGEDPKGRCNYMSNAADRTEIVALMKEMIERFKLTGRS